jgi:DNA-binding GntR family transcriptional regulator
MSALAPLHTRSLSTRAYDSIVEAVLDGSIGPGDRMIMDTLAERLQVSRTPIRDALQRLQQEGLIVPVGKRGYVVRQIGDEEVAQIYATREAIEGHGALLLAALPDRVTRVASIEATVDIAEASHDGSMAASWLANRSIHRSIVEVVGNGYLLKAFDALWADSVAAVAYAQRYRVENEPNTLRAEHLDLLAALRKGSPTSARATMVSHIRDGLVHHLARSGS